MYQKHIGNLLILQSNLLKEYKEVIHGVSTRIGGVSSGTFASLNLSLTTGDNISNVTENRRRLCQALGVRINTLSISEQIHKSNIKVIKNNGTCGIIPFVDSMLTNQRNITLMALSADCPLVICYDPIKKVIGLIHASWRGLAGNICRKTIKRMKQEFNCQPENILAVISPSIDSCCYEVKQDLIDKIITRNPYGYRYFKKLDNKIFFDIRSFARAQLMHTGLRLRHIESMDICTKCHPEWFYSFRRDGAKTGRFGVLLTLQSA